MILRCVEKFHFKIEFNSQAGSTLLSLNEGRHFPRKAWNPTIIYHSLSDWTPNFSIFPIFLTFHLMKILSLEERDHPFKTLQVFTIFDPYPLTIGIPAKCLWRRFSILMYCDLLTIGTSVINERCQIWRISALKVYLKLNQNVVRITLSTYKKPILVAHTSALEMT